MSQDTNTGTKDLYYNCVNSSATQDFSVTPEYIYDRLLRSTDVYNLYSSMTIYSTIVVAAESPEGYF